MCRIQGRSPRQPTDEGVIIAALAAWGPILRSAGILILGGYVYALTVGLLDLLRDRRSHSDRTAKDSGE